MDKMLVNEWYKNEFPTDADISRDMNKITFENLWTLMKLGHDFYNLIGVSDSIVRERVFLKLADINVVTYSYVYDVWLGKL